ncbi:MAG: hypothetical protein ABIG93_01090, partial [archaeon]
SNLNRQANVTFENVNCNLCNNNNIIYSAEYYTTQADILANGQSCTLAGTCSAFTCNNPGGVGNCTFDVTGFTGYAVGGNANLTINDSAEGSTVNINTAIDFNAYYVNSTSGASIADASCNVSFDDAPSTWYQMTWNGTGDSNYNYTKTSGFANAATHVWNVTCAKTGFTTLTTNDTVVVTSAGGGAVPEFKDYAIVLLVLTIVGGFMVIRERNS